MNVLRCGIEKIALQCIRIKADDIPFCPSSSKEDICIVLSRVAPAKRIELVNKSFSSRILKDKKLYNVGYASKENIIIIITS